MDTRQIKDLKPTDLLREYKKNLELKNTTQERYRKEESHLRHEHDERGRFQILQARLDKLAQEIKEIKAMEKILESEMISRMELGEKEEENGTC